MNVLSIENKASRLTNASLANFLTGVTADILEELNIQYGYRILDILKISVDKNASINETTTDLISTVGLTEGQNGFNGEYSFPTDLLKPTRLEVSYDGKTWKKCRIYDNSENNYSEYKDSQLSSVFSQANPYVDFTRDSFKIRPPKTTSGNVTKGIYIEYEKRQVDLTNGEPEFEKNLHDVLAHDLAEQEMIMHSKKYDANQWSMFRTSKAEAEARFNEFYKNRFKRNFKINIDFSSSNLSYN